MADELASANAVLKEFERLVDTGATNPFEGPLRCGVDLGTANIVLAVVDEDNKPVAGASFPSKVVRDGVVVDYIGAIRVVTRLKDQLEQALGVELDAGACAIPPGVAEGSVKALGNVVEGAGFRLAGVLDEPTAASLVLEIKEGAVVDVGGGTTGISILHEGKVTFTADEPTGGGHMTLVLSGAMGISTEEAEAMKRDPAQERLVYPAVRFTVEKMAAIVKQFLSTDPTVDTVYVVGGACSFSEFAATFEKYLGLRVVKPYAPLLVTPLGIAYGCGA
ncbi:ethanolamine utilization protein EutJ [Olsenella uli]|uniref:ethanolamine utilization protein EutJ n=1 Tax=Olsenella uli TaxID=133926 RepID=UPI0012AC1B37|nr:ethanolamine utilization protein EutJ [Olsenella uli]